MKHAGILAVVLLILQVLDARPAPHGSLRRVDDVVDARFTWEVAGAYYPQGTEGVGMDQQGEYFTFTQFTGETQLSASATWRFSRIASLSVTVKERVANVRELRTYATGELETVASYSDVSFASSVEYRVAPDDALDPRIRITHSPPASTAVSVLLSYVFDPVVLGCLAGIEGTAEYPPTWLTVSLSAGLVANSRVDVSVTGQWRIPLEGAGLPTSAIGLHSRYSFDNHSRRTLHFRVTLSTSGQTTWVGFGGSIRISAP